MSTHDTPQDSKLPLRCAADALADVIAMLPHAQFITPPGINLHPHAAELNPKMIRSLAQTPVFAFLPHFQNMKDVLGDAKAARRAKRDLVSASVRNGWLMVTSADNVAPPTPWWMKLITSKPTVTVVDEPVEGADIVVTWRDSERVIRVLINGITGEICDVRLPPYAEKDPVGQNVTGLLYNTVADCARNGVRIAIS